MKFNAKEMRKLSDTINNYTVDKYIDSIQKSILNLSLCGDVCFTYDIPEECNKGQIDAIKKRLHELKFGTMMWYDKNSNEQIYITW